MRRAKILIVEDEKIVAADIRKSVEAMGYLVCAVASSGEEAIHKAHETRPDVALMDIVLKGAMDGVQAAEQIGARFKIPIVYLTAYDDEDTLQRAKITTPYGYIVKPFNDRELHIAIEIALYKHQAEGNIRKTEHRLAVVLRSVGDAVIASDEEGRVTFLNSTAEKLTGWKKEEALGKKLMEVLTIKEEERESLERHLLEKVMTEGVIINLLEDRVLVAKDGTETPISDSAAPIRDDDGGTPGTVLVFRDISERKQAEDLLAKAVQEWQSTFDATNDAIWILDEDQRVLRSNRTAERFFHRSCGEMIGRHCWEIVHGTEEPIPECPIPRVRKSLRRETMELEVGDHWFEVNVDPVLDAAGRYSGAVHIVSDITERKRIEKSVKQRTDAMEAAIAGMALLNEEEKYIYLNKAHIEIYGYANAEELIGKSWRVLYDSDALRRFDQDIMPDFGRKGSWHGEALGMKKDGSKFPQEVSLTALEDGGLICIVSDITERKRVDAAIRESEERFRGLFERATVGKSLTAPDGKLLQINQAFADMLGYTIEEMVQLNFAQITHPDDVAKGKECIRLLLAGEQDTYRFEKRYLHRNGDIVWTDVSTTLLHDGKGTPLYLITSIVDITERKRAEEEKEKLQGQLLQSQKMEAIGQLAGGVAHDFNNMLGVILGHAEIALEQVDSAQSLHANLQEIKKAAERSSDLTRQLLAFARKQTIFPKELDMNETVAGMLKMLQRLIGEDIHLAWLPGVNLWPVKMDPSQIDQLLANLCVNARDAISGVGKVTIETGTVSFDETYCADHEGFVPGEYVLLAVSDDGCGMDKEVLGRLFEPFFTTKGIGKGTGLGLATVYGIVKQNSGFINVYSERDQGTTFKIYLPRHIGAGEQVQAEKQEEPVRRGQETVLVVEDEPSLLDLSKLLLEKWGYRVLTAGTPGEAIRLAGEHTGEIHLLMTDVVMPEMNGRALAKKILSRHPNLKCLFMSGYTANVIAHHGVLDEGVPFLQKPFTRKDLAAKVRKTLDQK